MVEEHCVKAASRQVGAVKGISSGKGGSQKKKKVCNKQQNNEKFNLATEICNAAYWKDVEEQSKSCRKTKICCSASTTVDTYKVTFNVSLKFSPTYGSEASCIGLVGIRKIGTWQI